MKKNNLKCNFLVFFFIYIILLNSQLFSIENVHNFYSNPFKIVLSDTYNDLKNNFKDFFSEINKKCKVVILNIEENCKSLEQEIKDIDLEIDKLKNKIKLERDNLAFNNKILDIIEKKKLILNESLEIYKKALNIINEHLDFLKNFLEIDNSFIEHIKLKTVYELIDFFQINSKILKEKEQETYLRDRKIKIETTIKNGQVNLNSKAEELKSKIEEIKKIEKEDEDNHSKSKIIIFDFEKDLIIAQEDLEKAFILNNKVELDFINSKILITLENLKILNSDLDLIRDKVIVDQSDIHRCEAKLKIVKKNANLKIKEFGANKNKLLEEKNILKKELDELCYKNEVSLSNKRQVEEWEINTNLIPDLYSIISVAVLKTKFDKLEREIEELNLKILLEEAHLKKEELNLSIAHSFYKITHKYSEDKKLIENSVNKYKIEEERIYNLIKSNNNELNYKKSFIQNQQNAINNINKLKEKIKNFDKISVSKYQEKYIKLQAMLSYALQNLENQNNITLRIIQLYKSLEELQKEDYNTVKFIISELSKNKVWHRSALALSWNGIKNIGPNIVFFFAKIIDTILAYSNKFSFKNLIFELTNSTAQQIIFFIIFIFLLFVGFSLFNIFVSFMKNFFEKLEEPRYFIFFISKILDLIFGFLDAYFSIIYSWVSVLFFILIFKISAAIILLFYIFSIFFFIFLAYRFYNYLLNYNLINNYVFFIEKFKNRVSAVFYFFSLSSIFIIFLKQIIEIIYSNKYEYISFLTRLYHVIIFISVILIINKNTLLNFIFRKKFLNLKIRKFLENYFYVIFLLLLSILIISDPYLGGYGKLVWYILVNSLLTISIALFFYYFYKIVKKYSELIFFKQDGEFSGITERFEYSKAWHGAFLIFLFLFNLLLSIFLILYIWNFKIKNSDFIRFWSYKLFAVQYIIDKKTGLPIERWLTVKSVFLIIIISLSGFLFAYLFNKFILKPIFDAQYADPGVQDTVMVLSRYIIIITMIFVAFAKADLGTIVMYALGVGLLALGWVFKDLFTDIVAYFFILIQRPIKIGDYIKIDENILGVVRKIGARAVILRRNNSVTIVVPNSVILKNSIYNWNYNRGFIAFDDILFTVPFYVNIDLVKVIMFKVLDEDPDVLKVPQPIVRLEDFNDKGYQFLVRGFLSSNNTLNQWDIKSNVRFKIVKLLAKEGITIAEPVCNIKLNKKD